MYVRVLHFTCREDTQKSQIQDIYRMVVDEARDRDGFVGSALLIRENACSYMAMMYWRDQTAAADAGPSIVTLLGEHVHDLMVNPPDIAGYHVVEHGMLPDAN